MPRGMRWRGEPVGRSMGAVITRSSRKASAPPRVPLLACHSLALVVGGVPRAQPGAGGGRLQGIKWGAEGAVVAQSPKQPANRAPTSACAGPLSPHHSNPPALSPLPQPRLLSSAPRSSQRSCPFSFSLLAAIKAAEFSPRRVLSAIAIGAAAATVAAVAVVAHPLASSSSPTIRQEGEAPDTLLPTAALLAIHCDGTPIIGEVETERETSGSWEGNCNLVLTVPGGELNWGPGSTATISGALSIRLSAALPPDADDSGEVEWKAGSVTTAASLAVDAADIDVQAGSSLIAIDGGVELLADGYVYVGPGTNVSAPAGGVVLAATANVELGAGSSLNSGAGNVRVAAGTNLDVQAGASASAAEVVAFRAARAATLWIAALSAGEVVLVTAPSCITSGGSFYAPTVEVC